MRNKKPISVCKAKTLESSLLLDSALDIICQNPAAVSNWNYSSLRLLLKTISFLFLLLLTACYLNYIRGYCPKLEIRKHCTDTFWKSLLESMKAFCYPKRHISPLLNNCSIVVQYGITGGGEKLLCFLKSFLCSFEKK